MNQSFYIGALGAHQQLKRLNVQSHNIANVNTQGYKAEKARFQSLMTSNIKGIDDVQLPAGTGTLLWTTTTDHTQMGLADTGRPMDYAIHGDGFFALADLRTGEITYTREGGFVMSSLQVPTDELDEEGVPVMEEIYYLSDNDGRFVMSDKGGMIQVTDPNAQYPVGVFDHINYNGMDRLFDSRFQAIDKNGAIFYGEGELLWKKLEMSNVDLAEEMTKVIEAQRAYGLALKMVQTSDEIETTINGLR